MDSEEKMKNEVEKEPVDFAEDVEDAAEKTAEEKTGSDPAKDAKKGKGKKDKSEAELIAAKAKIDALLSELAEEKERYTRMYAEYENFRKRTAKEKENTWTDAVGDTLTSILPVLDNLDRAAGAEGDAEAVRKGLDLTRKSFLDALAKLGVEEIEAEGKTFDPALHNAVMHVEDETLGENEIVEVLMKGYKKGDKVLRYSMVKVAN